MYDDDFGSEMEALESERLDADLEMAQMNARANYLASLREQGICTHSSAVGYVGKVNYPEQKGLKPGQSRCTEGTGGCERVFNSDEEWFAAMEEL